MSIWQRFLRLFGRSRRRTGAPEKTRRDRAAEKYLAIEELAARVGTLFDAWQNALAAAREARAQGQPSHVQERLNATARRMERRFQNVRNNLRTLEEVQEVQTQEDAVEEQYGILVHDDDGAAMTGARDLYVTRRRFDERQTRLAIDERVLEEALAPPQEHCLSPCLSEPDRCKAGLSLESDQEGDDEPPAEDTDV